MNRDLVEQILSCPNLPSLPAVALRVIELTSDPNVRLSDLASTIQNDQGLAAKVLKTVNSSFYALRQPCATISKALVLLGLGPVKTLALGFSLVSSLESRQFATFDYVGYWRRGLYSAVAAKCLAEAARKPFSEEAFLAGLLQDLGVMAMLRTLGTRYIRTFDKAGGDHRALVAQEIADLEVQHPEIGALLAERWKLPEQLVMPVRYHERPTAAPVEHAEMCRCIGLANLIHDALTDAAPGPALRKAYSRADQWMRLDTAAVDAVLRRTSLGAKELSRLFKLDTGPFSDPEHVITHAEKQRADLEVAETQGTSEVGMSALLASDGQNDPVTGVLARSEFDGILRKSFAEAVSASIPVGLVYVAVNSFREILAVQGVERADELLVRVAHALSEQFEMMGGVTCRVSNEVFAIVVEGSSAEGVEKLLEAAISTMNSGGQPLVSVSSGIAMTPGPDGARLASEAELVIAATRALHRSRQTAAEAPSRKAA